MFGNSVNLKSSWVYLDFMVFKNWNASFHKKTKNKTCISLREQHVYKWEFRCWLFFCQRSLNTLPVWRQEKIAFWRSTNRQQIRKICILRLLSQTQNWTTRMHFGLKRENPCGDIKISDISILILQINMFFFISIWLWRSAIHTVTSIPKISISIRKVFFSMFESRTKQRFGFIFYKKKPRTYIRYWILHSVALGACFLFEGHFESSHDEKKSNMT